MESLFQRSAGYNLKLAFLCILSITLMTVDHRFNHLRFIRSLLSDAIYPIEYLVNVPSTVMDTVAENAKTQTMLRHQVERLQSENQAFKVQQQRMDMLIAENKRLRQLLGSAERLQHQVLIAELLSIDLDPFRQQVRVNKGTSSGVYIGQPMIDASGIMGQITEVSSLSSMALLISDPSHAIPVELVRNGLRSIAEGTGQSDQLSLLYLPQNADVRVGDRIISSGLGGIFPRGYPVAVIHEIQYPPAQPFAMVYARPTALLDRSREVLLIAVQKKLSAAETESPEKTRLAPKVDAVD